MRVSLIEIREMIVLHLLVLLGANYLMSELLTHLSGRLAQINNYSIIVASGAIGS
jgi:hypothetical protein